MKEYKILHLFPRLLSLYGEYGNVAILEKVMKEHGHSVSVTCWENGDLDLTGYDFIYVGSGTEDNLLEAVKRLAPHAEAIASSIAGGQLWLATGNAMTLFGRTITRKGDEYRGLGCFSYTTEINENKRFLGDVLAFLNRTDLISPYVGFINTSCIYHGVENPLLVLQLNPHLGNDKTSSQDGIRSGNFYGTQLIGPVLVKNPNFLCEIFETITGEKLTLDKTSNICMANTTAVTKLQARIQ